MKIGIDIDDTLFDTDEVLISCALQYDKEFVNNRGFRDKNSYHFVEKFYWNKNNVFDFFKKFHEENYIFSLKPKDNCVSVLSKLKEEGYEIVIITSRKSVPYLDIYEKTKEMLINNGICFDKLIVDVKDKGIVCEREAIDIFIDDRIEHCVNVVNHGVKHVVLFETEYNKNERFLKYNNWNDIYDYIRRVNNGRKNC